jgi:thiol-disulfide isomerase/thioredoxin
MATILSLTTYNPDIMAIIQSTDQQLRKLGLNDKFTIVFYDNENCSYCKRLIDPYIELSERPEYHEISFLRISAEENPVARAEVDLKRMPFLSIYKQGLLIDCGCVRSVNGIIRFLEKLKRQERPFPLQETLLLTYQQKR